MLGRSPGKLGNDYASDYCRDHYERDSRDVTYHINITSGLAGRCKSAAGDRQDCGDETHHLQLPRRRSAQPKATGAAATIAGSADHGPPRDTGAGVLNWLQDDFAEYEHVRFSSIVPWFSLRGGAITSGGDGDNIEDVTSRGPDRPYGDPQPRADDDHSADLQNGTCPPLNRRASLPPPVITGASGGAPVIICNLCCRDWPIKGITWRQCRCAAFRCPECAAVPCPHCHTVAAEDYDHPEGLPTHLPAVDGDVERYTCDGNIESWTTAAHGTGEGVDSHVRNDTYGSALTCVSCQTGSRQWHGDWYICGCGHSFCGDCSPAGCGCCGHKAPEPRRGLAYTQPAAAASSAIHSAHVDEHLTSLQMPPILSPEEAVERRSRLLADHASTLKMKRAEDRSLARRQEREGTRPRRPRAKGSTTSFATVNITAARRLREELQRGGELAKCDYIGVQETGLYGELVGQATDWIKRCGWSGVLDAAYRKNGGYGGGTAALTRHAAGIRRAGQTRSPFQGRKTSTITHQGRAINFTVFYGISGAPLSSQIPLWKELADDLLCVARPFVVAGDWQRPPQDLRGSGLCHLLDAVVCAPDCATNLLSGNQIDYFLVSRTLVQSGWSIRPLHGCLFRPHIPIVLDIPLLAEPVLTRRLVQPRLLPIEKPTEVHPPALIVDWKRWNGPRDVEEVSGCEKDAQVDAITRAAESWCAGAEAELLSIYGLAGHKDEAHYLGIGQPHRVVEERTRTRYRDVADPEGLLGHRIEWTLKSLCLARDLGGIIRGGSGRPSPLGPASITSDIIERHIDTLSRIGHRAMAFGREDPPASVAPPTPRHSGPLSKERFGSSPTSCAPPTGRDPCSSYGNRAKTTRTGRVIPARPRSTASSTSSPTCRRATWPINSARHGASYGDG